MSPLDLSLRSPLQQLTTDSLLTAAQLAFCPSSQRGSSAEGQSRGGFASTGDVCGAAPVGASASAAAGAAAVDDFAGMAVELRLSQKVDAVTRLLLYARQLTVSTCDR